MRAEFASAILNNITYKENQVFMTGDLGFMALEEIQKEFGDRFINAGVAEQNMVTVAAGIANQGFIPWVYSIAPFVTLRPYEQIRNDICFHDLPVKLVGNGGGYGYGIMGATHHNPEDIGAMRLLPNMEIFIPFLTSDLEDVVKQMLENQKPNYLRLNLGAKINFNISSFATWRRLKKGKKAIIIGTGPVLANIFDFNELMDDVEVWLVSKFPYGEIPEEIVEVINTTKKLLVIEEHYQSGGLGESLSIQLLQKIKAPIYFQSLHALGYPSGKYGSQKWHQEESNLAGNKLKNQLLQLLK